jgi:hypothetical protein
VSLLAAPAIVRESSLMPVKALPILQHFDEIAVPVGWDGSNWNIEGMRDIFLPGLREIRCQYESLPVMWESLFND